MTLSNFLFCFKEWKTVAKGEGVGKEASKAGGRERGEIRRQLSNVGTSDKDIVFQKWIKDKTGERKHFLYSFISLVSDKSTPHSPPSVRAQTHCYILWKLSWLQQTETNYKPSGEDSQALSVTSECLGFHVQLKPFGDSIKLNRKKNTTVIEKSRVYFTCLNTHWAKHISRIKLHKSVFNCDSCLQHVASVKFIRLYSNFFLRAYTCSNLCYKGVSETHQFDWFHWLTKGLKGQICSQFYCGWWKIYFF